jgi:diguanylate cyclase (GGDEF)-like protein/PAS domain S-box-containing protein
VAPTGQRTSGDGPEPVRVLQLEDNPVDAELIGRQLADDGLPIVSRVVASELSFRKAIADFAPQVVLSDFSLPGFDGLAALRIAKEVAPATPFIFVSGTIGEERAIEALKRGAVDYVLKDNLRRLVPAIKAALREREATRAKDLAEEMLRRSESRLQDIINTSRDWIWECDQEGRFTFSSPSVLEILGYKHHELLGRRAADYVDPADELQMQATFAELMSEEQFSKGVTLRWRNKAGRTRWLERSMVALRDEHGVLTGVRGIDRDVTIRMAQEARIRRLNRALRFVSGASSAVMRLRDRGQLLKEACRLAVSVGGYRKATIYLLPADGNASEPIICSFGSTEVAGMKWTMGGALPVGVTPVTQALATGRPVILGELADAADFGIRQPDRDKLLAAGLRSSIALPLIMDGTSIGVIELHADEAGVFGDAELALLKQVADNITFSLRYLQSKESAEYLEYFDPLTGLANRSLYLQRLAHAIEEAGHNSQRLALVVLDITGLGMINDGLGHHAGDLLLQLVAERLKNVFRDTNLVCRLGGDRFAVMSADAALDAATVLKEQVACVFDAPFQIHDRELRVSVRAGLAQAPDDDRDAESILQHAQTALEHAKKAGERYLRHRPNMNAKASERLSLISDLRQAVSERSFILHYQPKLELGSNRVDGVEALLRWPPRRGDAVPPNVFVPMLESLGLIDDVGAWVIVQALAETADWATADDAFRVAVNVSPLQLNREDFADRVLELVASVAGASHRLELEITESTLMADPRRASSSLARLREAGVTIAIDDFGTGHSSLRVLSGLPVDVLKIDRSFVHDITTNRSHRLIVQTTINLARSLGLKTVAEGVETQEQAAVLADLGCLSIQGYLIRRPAGAAETALWLAAPERGCHERRSLSDRAAMPDGPGSGSVAASPRYQRRDN